MIEIKNNPRTWLDLQGFWQPHDWADYEHLVNEVPDGGLLVEVGSFRGKSLCSIAETLKRKNMYAISIDLFDQVDSPEYEEPEVYRMRKGMLEDFKANLEEFGISERVNVRPATSIDGAATLERLKEHPDMVFIDADHSYEAVYKDIEAWWPLVKEGGIIAFHDFDHNGYQWPGVHKAIHEKLGAPAFGVYMAAFKKINGQPVPQVGMWQDPRPRIGKIKDHE